MAAIRSIETSVPGAVAEQSSVRDLLLEQPGYGRLGRRLVTAAFDGSAIETRHVVVDEFAGGARGLHPEFVDPATGAIKSPGTRARNDAYAAAAPAMLLDAARRAIDSAPGVTAADVTHVVTVSCTGFFSPGPDFVLVRDLGLDPATQRAHLGFMGCCAAFPALRIAEQFVRANARAVVLVVALELCSLHLHVDDDPDQIVAASVFADGAAAAIVTASPEPGDALAAVSPVLELDDFRTGIVPGSETEMAWTIGDHGFDMTLSSYVPRVVGQSIRSSLAPLLAGRDEPDLWAIHPGGRSILDRVQGALGLDDGDLAPSREVLRRFGNMSSATVLFILRDLMQRAAAPATITADPRAEPRAEPGAGSADTRGLPRTVCAVAFGPGLTVEAAALTLRPALPSPSATPGGVGSEVAGAHA